MSHHHHHFCHCLCYQLEVVIHGFSNSGSQIVDKSQLLEGFHPQKLECHVEKDKSLEDGFDQVVKHNIQLYMAGQKTMSLTLSLMRGIMLTL